MTKVIPESKTPAFIQRLHWAFDPVGYLESNHQQYPDLFAVKIFQWGKQPIVYVSHPQAIQQILTNDRKVFTAPAHTNELLRPLVGDYSVILLEGERHGQRRQLLAPPFHGERLYSYGKSICKITEEVIDHLPVGQAFTGRTVTQNITLQIILEVVFGIREGERYDKLRKLISKMLNVFNSPLTSALNPNVF